MEADEAGLDVFGLGEHHTPEYTVSATATVLAAAAAPDVQQAMKIQGVDPAPGAPEAAAERIKADVVKWKEVVTAAKIAGVQQ